MSHIEVGPIPIESEQAFGTVVDVSYSIYALIVIVCMINLIKSLIY